MNIHTASEVQYLSRPEGRIAYTVEGSGPLVIAVPGMGDLRSSFRELVDPLLDAGFRVAVTDLRGHGDSDTSFRTHGDIATGTDILALIDQLGGPAVVLGNSMGAAAAAWAAAEQPHAIAGLVLYGPLLREPNVSAAGRALLHALYHVAFARPWGAGFWAGYYRSLNKGTQAPWLAEHVDEIHANLGQPGRLRSFRQLALQLDHRPVEARLGDVRAPIRAFVGDRDPDFKDPQAENAWLNSLGARSQIVVSSGHYPHAQHPEIVVPATLEFIESLRADAVDGSGWAERA